MLKCFSSLTLINCIALSTAFAWPHTTFAAFRPIVRHTFSHRSKKSFQDRFAVNARVYTQFNELWLRLSCPQYVQVITNMHRDYYRMLVNRVEKEMRKAQANKLETALMAAMTIRNRPRFQALRTPRSQPYLLSISPCRFHSHFAL